MKLTFNIKGASSIHQKVEVESLLCNFTVTYEDTIAPEAITINLLLSNEESLSNILSRDITKYAWNRVKLADYASALQAMEILIALFPEDHIAVFRYAALFCDYANVSHSDLNCENAKQLLFSSLLEIDDKRHRDSCKNEFYYSTGQFKKQFILGRQTEATNTWGKYKKGVGGCNQALKELKNGHRLRSIYFAKRGVEAFESFHREVPDYYNSYVHLSVGYYLLGRRKTGNKAARIALELCPENTEATPDRLPISLAALYLQKAIYIFLASLFRKESRYA